MSHEESHERVPAEDEDLRKAIMEMREMMKILMERNALFQGEGIRETVVIKLQMEMEGMVLLHHPLLHHLLLLLLLPVRDLFRILQRGMVKLLRKFLH